MGQSTSPHERTDSWISALFCVNFKFDLFLCEIVTQIYVKIPPNSLSGSPEPLRSLFETENSEDVRQDQPASRVQMFNSRGVSTGQPEVSCVQHVSLRTFKQEPTQGI